MKNQTSQQVATFNIEQAKELIKNGIKISHLLWNPGEFIMRHWRDGFYVNEDEKMIDASKFWNHRFDSGYVIWNESDVDEDDFIDSED
jgi:hypothetical protein